MKLRARRRIGVADGMTDDPLVIPRPSPPTRLEPAACVGFGPHLVFDGYGCPVHRIDDVGRIYGLLDRLPDRIGMTKIMPPYVFHHGSAGEAGEGVSGFVLIAESHISVHTFLARGFVNVDIFSCEKFDVADALDALKEAFQPQRVDWKLLDRGLEFPKHLAHSRAIVARGRRAIARTIGLEASR
jgi:S-adenosylmethionine decarboxylase